MKFNVVFLEIFYHYFGQTISNDVPLLDDVKLFHPKCTANQVHVNTLIVAPTNPLNSTFHSTQLWDTNGVASGRPPIVWRSAFCCRTNGCGRSVRKWWWWSFTSCVLHLTEGIAAHTPVSPTPPPPSSSSQPHKSTSPSAQRSASTNRTRPPCTIKLCWCAAMPFSTGLICS